MAFDIRKTTTPTLSVVPNTLQAALDAATVRVVSPADVELATPTATLDTVSATVASVANGTEVDLDDATGFVAGRQYLLLADSGPELIYVERVDAGNDRLYLSSRPSDAVRVGDVIVGATVSATLTSACTATLGFKHRVEWLITDTAGNEYPLQTMYNVVNWPLAQLATPRMVRQILRGYSGDYMQDRFGPAELREVAQKADDRVRMMIEQSGRKPTLYAEPEQFEHAAEAAIHVVLANSHTLTPAAYEAGPAEWQRDKQKVLEREFDAAIRRLGWYDEPETREPDDVEVSAKRYSSLDI